MGHWCHLLLAWVLCGEKNKRSVLFQHSYGDDDIDDNDIGDDEGGNDDDDDFCEYFNIKHQMQLTMHRLCLYNRSFDRNFTRCCRKGKMHKSEVTSNKFSQKLLQLLT